MGRWAESLRGAGAVSVTPSPGLLQPYPLPFLGRKGCCVYVPYSYDVPGATLCPALL